MRHDYQYVDQATSLVLTTTRDGHKEIVSRVEQREEGEPTSTVTGEDDLLLAVEEDYFIMGSGESIEWWFNDYRVQYKKNFGAESPTTIEDFRQLILKNFLTIKKVIWD